MSLIHPPASSEAALTPCAGRCSTVFGDAVCRGCRRFNHEVIEWNRYDDDQKIAVWQRLDRQLDQTLIPLLPHHDLMQVEAFLQQKRVRLPLHASTGRRLYAALRRCEKAPHLVTQSGLGISPDQVRPLWQAFEHKVLLLAQASYELAWLRAEIMGQGQHWSPDESVP